MKVAQKYFNHLCNFQLDKNLARVYNGYRIKQGGNEMLSLSCNHMFKEGCGYWVLYSEDYGAEATADTKAEIMKEYRRLLKDDKSMGIKREYTIEHEVCGKVVRV